MVLWNNLIMQVKFSADKKQYSDSAKNIMIFINRGFKNEYTAVWNF